MSSKISNIVQILLTWKKIGRHLKVVWSHGIAKINLLFSAKSLSQLKKNAILWWKYKASKYTCSILSSILLQSKTSLKTGRRFRSGCNCCESLRGCSVSSRFAIAILFSMSNHTTQRNNELFDANFVECNFQILYQLKLSIIKGGVISESFSFLFKSKNGATIHLRHWAPFFGDLSQDEKKPFCD